jgi:Zn-dependent metalloprotease
MAFAPQTSEIQDIIPPQEEGSKVFTSSEALRLKVKTRFPSAVADFSSHTGMLSCLHGQLVKASSLSALQIAETFIESHRDIFGDAFFRVGRTLVENGNTHITFDQVVDGIKVHGKTLNIHVNKDGSVTFVSSDIAVELVSAKSNFILSNDEAVQFAMADLKTDESALRGDVSVEQAYLPMRSAAPAVWIVQIPSSKPLGDWELHVDATTGKILSRRNFLQFLSKGAGTVFRTNPTKSGPGQVSIINMTKKSSLSGPYVYAKNDDVDDASESDGKYHYDLKNTHFDEVNVFYHLNVIHDYFSSVHGFKDLDKTMTATVHYGENYDNAYYSPWSGGFAFGDGNKLNDLAREAAVIYHEYTHAVTGSIVNLVYADESGAMNEGYSDYFGCVLTKDPQLGEWAVQKMNKPYMRSLVDTVHYPENIEHEVHADGKIWGCVCWDLLLAVGEETASKLLHKSRYYLAYRSTFVDGLKGVIEADAQLFSGKHKDQIIKAFAGRGIVLEAAADKAQTGMKFNELFEEDK